MPCKKEEKRVYQSLTTKVSFSYGQNLELWIFYYWFLVYLSIFKVILSHLAFSNCAFQAHRHLATSSPMRQTRCVVQANIKSQRSNDDLTLQSDDFPCRISGGSVSRVAAMQDGLDFFTVRTLMMAVNWVSGEAEHRRFEEFEKAQPGIDFQFSTRNDFTKYKHGLFPSNNSKVSMIGGKRGGNIGSWIYVIYVEMGVPRPWVWPLKVKALQEVATPCATRFPSAPAWPSDFVEKTLQLVHQNSFHLGDNSDNPLVSWKIQKVMKKWWKSVNVDAPS